jgi:hypothetical protein
MFGCAAGPAMPVAVDGLVATSARVRGLHVGDPFLPPAPLEPFRESRAKFGAEAVAAGGDAGR